MSSYDHDKISIMNFDSGVGVYFESLLPMGDLLKFDLL